MRMMVATKEALVGRARRMKSNSLSSVWPWRTVTGGTGGFRKAWLLIPMMVMGDSDRIVMGTPMGCGGYAILLLRARLGLRARR